MSTVVVVVAAFVLVVVVLLMLPVCTFLTVSYFFHLLTFKLISFVAVVLLCSELQTKTVIEDAEDEEEDDE